MASMMIIKLHDLPLVHTISNLVWLSITDYGEKLGCPYFESFGQLTIFLQFDNFGRFENLGQFLYVVIIYYLKVDLRISNTLLVLTV